jgi:hypothetical protein
MESKINSNDRFIRWQQILREQLTYLNNILLTFSVATLGFLFSLLTEDNFVPTCYQKLFFTFGLIMIFLSIFIGLATSFSRLFDFRTTLKKIKNETSGNHADIEEQKQLKDMYSKSTWNLFYGQSILFVLGVLTLTVAFVMIYKHKIY